MTQKLPIVTEQASSLRSDGSRNYVHPADVSGRFTTMRNVVFTALIVVLVALPFIRINGYPSVFLDIVNRRFYLFGRTFNAQDFWLAFFLLSGMALLLLVVTAVKGRIWCGYACPHTVFLEGVFRRIERFIEGPRVARIRRNNGPATWDKAWRKTLKHAIYVAVSLLLSHVFLSYFVSLPSLTQMVQKSPAEHPTAFTWVVVMSAILYFNFSWFREQLCLIVCPYGRLQSALTDRDTLVIGYDTARGEPRGKANDPSNGDCVNCNRCVVVCPTGIDIRNGLQMECVGCAACVDACDEIMDKVGRDPGLVRYDSLNGFESRPKHTSRPRLYFYGALTLAWLVGAGFAFTGSKRFEANLLRYEGAPFVVVDGIVRNSIRVHLVNKANEARTFSIAATQNDVVQYVLPVQEITLNSLGSTYIPVLATVPVKQMRPDLEISLRVSIKGSAADDEDARKVIRAKFVGPRAPPR